MILSRERSSTHPWATASAGGVITPIPLRGKVSCQGLWIRSAGNVIVVKKTGCTDKFACLKTAPDATIPTPRITTTSSWPSRLRIARAVMPTRLQGSTYMAPLKTTAATPVTTLTRIRRRWQKSVISVIHALATPAAPTGHKSETVATIATIPTALTTPI